MRLLVAAAVALVGFPLSVSSSHAAAQEASKEVDDKAALAVAIVDRAFPADRRIAMFEATANQIEAQMLASLSKQIDDEDALRLVEEWQLQLKPAQNELLVSHLPHLMEGVAGAYAEIFTETELRDILDFVSTDSGQAFMLKGSEIMASPAFAEANQAFMDETMALTMDRLPELVETIVAYKAEQEAAAAD